MLDITENKRIEEALRNSEEKFRALAESITDVFFAMDNNLCYTYWNKASEKLTGILAKDALGKSLYEIFPGTRNSKLNKFYLNIINTNQPGKMVNNYTIDGTNYVFELNAYPLDSGVAVFTKNITEEVKAEEQLKKYKQIVSSTPDGVSLLDTNYRYEIINDTYEKISGLDRSQIVGHTVEEYLGADTFYNIVKEKFDRCLNGETIQYEDKFNFPNGEEKYIRVTYFPYLNIKNEITGIVAISHDITELKKSELKIQEYARELKKYSDHLEELVKQRTEELEKEKVKAESADHLKSAFMASMSHELRTPLNAIIGFTGILLQERPGPLNPEQKKQLGIVQYNAQHLLSLINDILDLSKIEAGQLNVNFEPFYLPEVIYKVIESSKQMLLKKNLKVNVSISPEVTEIVNDKLRIQQVLLNLVNNAIKFTEKGSLSIICSSDGKTISIKVSDTGIGIEKHRLKDIFLPFVQLDSGLERKHQGTGLGLSISKKLIDMLQGNISVESEPGKGSTFTITLPVKDLP